MEIVITTTTARLRVRGEYVGLGVEWNHISSTCLRLFSFDSEGSISLWVSSDGCTVYVNCFGFCNSLVDQTGCSYVQPR